MKRRSQIQISEYDGFGLNHMNSAHFARTFKEDKPHEFGAMAGKIFSSSNKFGYKPLTYHTLGSGRYRVIDNSYYRWTLAGDDEVPLYITEVPSETASMSRPGFGLTTFQIAIAEGYLKEPDVLLLDNNELPMLEIVGSPTQVGQYFYYTVRLQSSDPNDYIPLTEIAVGMRVRKVSSSVAEEGDIEGGTEQFQSGLQLESQFGMFAAEFSVTDKVIRRSLQAAQRNGNKSKYSTQYAWDVRDRHGNVYKAGNFITKAEALIENRVQEDREWSMHFGRSSTMTNASGYMKRTGPGYRELCKDGQIFNHNGDLTVADMEDFFHGIFLTRVNGEDRKVVVSTGEAGLRLFHKMVNTESASVLTVDTNIINPATDNRVNAKNALSYGHQYVQLFLINGIEVVLEYDPLKDNRQYCGRMHPDSPNFTVDSYRMDIWDFGKDMDGDSNMEMLMESFTEEWFYTFGAIDPKSGPINDGSGTNSGNRGVKFFRKTSGGLWIKDTSRIGSIILNI